MGKTTMNGTNIVSSGGLTHGTVGVQHQVGPNTTVGGHVSGYHHGGQTHVTEGGVGISHQVGKDISINGHFSGNSFGGRTGGVGISWTP